ncbi:tetratricopeptide repeat protein [Sphingosinithalassobacter sp. CS137]|uniref:tetratricopeptide repeat protein n=1 Tax=Sphingosinithalassobacter sp. CS137 TaxID=2762748 RepID=UPI00165DB160|nr:tetratricopeptide repeat protein [Sphingosinithalassobacter sp. CS137]
MTSSRKRRRRLPLRRFAVIGAGLAVCALALYLFWTLTPARSDPAAARAALAKSQQFLRDHNSTAARSQALEAVRNDPRWGAAHAMLARTMLEHDDGIGAEGELNRAVATGYDPKRIPHLMAHALLLQGDLDRALQTVEQTHADDRLYGLRVRARILTSQGEFGAAREALREALRLAPRDAAIVADIGRFRATAGDLLGAIEASERAVALDPGNTDALVLRGELVRSQYGLVAALPWFEAALKRDPWHHDALIEYAATLGDAGRTVDMLAATRRALQARPGSPQAHYLQAVLAARAGDPDLARRLLARTGGALANLPGAVLLNGALQLEAGADRQAIEALRQLVAMQPMNITARKLLAVGLLRTDAARDALDVLAPVVLRGDADSYALTLVARGLERIGDRENAALFLDRAAYPARLGSTSFSADDSIAVLAAPASANPGDPAAVIPLMRALIDAGKPGQALDRAREMARDNRGVPGAHILVGDMLMLLERPREAAQAFERAAAIRFDEPTMLRLVEAEEAAGDRRAAARAVALFLSQNPGNLAALRLTGHWQIAAQEYQAAIDTLELLRASVGERDAALGAELAMAYAGANELEAAREAAESAYSIAPSNPAAAHAYGWVLYREGDLEGAEELLVKAAKLAPGHPGIREHLARVRAERGAA